jgi:hypothetical protein
VAVGYAWSVLVKLSMTLPIYASVPPLQTQVCKTQLACGSFSLTFPSFLANIALGYQTVQSLDATVNGSPRVQAARAAQGQENRYQFDRLEAEYNAADQRLVAAKAPIMDRVNNRKAYIENVKKAQDQMMIDSSDFGAYCVATSTWCCG